MMSIKTIKTIKRCAVFLVSLAAFAVGALPAVAQDYMYAAKRSNVRSGPGTSYEKVGLLEIGERVRVTGKTGSWFQLGPRDRYVYAPLLTADRPASSSAVTTITYGNAWYHGQARNGKPHGRGVVTWTNGGRYEGDFVDGKQHGRGVKTWTNGNRYEGDFVDGKRTGRGVFTWADGDRYEGDFVDGEQHGRGVSTWTNGNRYEGDYVDGERTGRGVFTWADGDRYEGDFVDNKRNGRGVSTWTNGSRYEGDYVDGKRVGRGTLTFADGDSYTQEWRDGKVRDAHRPRETCLSVERSNGLMGVGAFVNKCRVGINALYRNEDSCRSRADKKYPCMSAVGANTKVTAMVGNSEGRVWWEGCQSPGGIADIVPIEKNGNVYCLDWASPKTAAHVDGLRRATQQKIAAQQRVQDWEREQESLDRLAAERAERKRRNTDMWIGIGQTLIEGVLNRPQYNPGAGSGTLEGDECQPETSRATCAVP